MRQVSIRSIISPRGILISSLHQLSLLAGERIFEPVDRSAISFTEGDHAMSRIAALDPAAAEPKAKSLLDGVEKSLGVTPNLFRVAAQSPAALEGLLSLSGALGHGALRPRVREAIALAVAEANACDYCLSVHTVLGRGAGLSDAEITAAREARAEDAQSNAILRFARLLVVNRGHATDSDLDVLRQAGLSEGEIVEVVANVVVNLFTNYLNHVAGTEIDFPVVHAGLSKAA